MRWHLRATLSNLFGDLFHLLVCATTQGEAFSGDSFFFISFGCLNIRKLHLGYEAHRDTPVRTNLKHLGIFNMHLNLDARTSNNSSRCKATAAFESRSGSPLFLNVQLRRFAACFGRRFGAVSVFPRQKSAMECTILDRFWAYTINC